MVGNSMPATTTSNVWHSSWTGGSAIASFSDGMTGLSGGFVQVWEGGTQTMNGASLWYNYFAYDPTSQVCYTYWFPWGVYQYCYYTRYSYDYGWGSIPASDVRITPAVVGVNTTVTSGPTFYATHCDIDYNNWWNANCYNVTGGRIDIRWTKHNTYSSFSTGTQQSDYGIYSYKTEGTSWNSAALASGSLLGHSFTNAGGQIGDSRTNTVSMTITRGGGNGDGGPGMGGMGGGMGGMGGGGTGGMGGSMVDANAGGSGGSMVDANTGGSTDGGDPMADGGM